MSEQALDQALAAGVAEMRAATARLQATVRGLGDEELRAPSRLPGWSRGHVLTHLARNADGLVNLVSWATTGVETPMYPSRDRRDSDIEKGAARPVAVVLADLETTAAGLEDACRRLPADALDRAVRTASATFPARDIALARTREIEIHHVDLDLGYRPEHWPASFVVRTLEQLAPVFRSKETPVTALVGSESGRRWQVGTAGPQLTGPEPALLAWLVGRSDGKDLVVSPDGPTPPAPRWA